MAGFGYVCAVLLAAVFVRAGMAKVARPASTVAGFVALGVPGAPAVARVVPFVELLLALALLSVPRVGAVAGLVVLAGFSAFLLGAVRGGVTAACNCFGQARTEPVSGLDLLRNGLLAMLAAAAVLARRPTRPPIPALLAALALVALGGAVLRTARRARFE